MVLVFTLLSKHRDQNPEARAGSAGVSWGFSALALTNFPTGCCPQNSFERQFLRFLVIYRKLVHRRYSFSNSQVLFQFLWSLCLNCTTVYWKYGVLVQKSREDIKKYLYWKKTQPNNGGASKYRCFLGFKIVENMSYGYMDRSTDIFLVKGGTFPELLICGQAAYTVV